MSKFYTNVNILVWMTTGLFSVLAAALAAAGLGAIVIPLAAGYVTGLSTVGLTFARRSKPFPGLFAPINLNAILTFLGVTTAVGVAIAYGLDPFLVEVAESAGQQLVLTFASGVIGGALAVISTFAARDSDIEEEDASPVPSRSHG